jgi:hypothetical protein
MPPKTVYPLAPPFPHAPRYTEDVRMDPDAWELVGEPGLQPGVRPWISEMYGYRQAGKVGRAFKRL